jgi:uncharacterized damage-inducible protein DinB
VDSAGVLLELYGRLPHLARGAVEGLSPEGLVAEPADGVNTIGWLVWHAARVEDHHIAELLGESQRWETGDWAARVGLEPDPSNTGYGHSVAEVRMVVPRSADDLLAYFDEVHARTAAWLVHRTAADLDEIVDRRWDPPVTLGVRLVSVADDGLQHLGQAAYARGLLGR